MKMVIYTCDVCNREIDKDKLVAIKIGKNTKHFCDICMNSADIESLVEKKKEK
jgi:hypothetical protein